MRCLSLLRQNMHMEEMDRLKVIKEGEGKRLKQLRAVVAERAAIP